MHHRSTLLLVFLTSLPIAACGDDGGGSTSDATTAATPATTTDPTSDATTTETPGTTEQGTGTTEQGTTEQGTTEPATSTTGPDPTTTTDPGTTEPGTTSSATDTDGTTGALGPSWAADVFPMLNPPVNCDCHTPGSGGLIMGPDPATAYMNLVGVMATTALLNRIEPGDTDKSYLWHKINGTQVQVGGGGSKMPLGGLPVLPQETFDVIDAWIAGGAQP